MSLLDMVLAIMRLVLMAVWSMAVHSVILEYTRPDIRCFSSQQSSDKVTLRLARETSSNCTGELMVSNGTEAAVNNLLHRETLHCHNASTEQGMVYKHSLQNAPEDGYYYICLEMRALTGTVYVELEMGEVYDPRYLSEDEAHVSLISSEDLILIEIYAHDARKELLKTKAITQALLQNYTQTNVLLQEALTFDRKMLLLQIIILIICAGLWMVIFFQYLPK